MLFCERWASVAARGTRSQYKSIIISGKGSERFLAAMEDGIILAEVDGEGMIIDVEKSTSYFLNETALLILRMVNERKMVDDMKAVLLEQYDVDEEAVEKDIRDFLVRLEKKAISWKKENTLSRR
jgi:hypothetical protein